MRRIKPGDKVQAFLDTRIIGIVKQIEANKDAPWMVGGTASPELVCVLELLDGRLVRYKLQELHHVDE